MGDTDMSDAPTPVAWRWTEGGEHPSGPRFSPVDPRENPEEMWLQGASSIGICEPLYTGAAIAALVHERDTLKAEVARLLDGVEHSALPERP
jgi:hypothetical protein